MTLKNLYIYCKKTCTDKFIWYYKSKILDPTLLATSYSLNLPVTT